MCNIWLGLGIFPSTQMSVHFTFFLLDSLSWHSAWASDLAKEAVVVSFSKEDPVLKTFISCIVYSE